MNEDGIFYRVHDCTLPIGAEGEVVYEGYGRATAIRRFEQLARGLITASHWNEKTFRWLEYTSATPAVYPWNQRRAQRAKAASK